MNKNQNGFSLVEVLIIIIVLAILGLAGYTVLNHQNQPKTTNPSSSNSNNNTQQSKKSPGGKIKNIGVNLGYYDAKTGRAGDFVFTKAKLHDNAIFMNYGVFIPASSASPAKNNPQPAYVLPMGTKVHSLVDGKVNSVTKLYSNDYSVLVQVEGSDLIFETEHVLNVVVKQGDSVKAGDVVAEVSNHMSNYNDGMGFVEIGVFKPGVGSGSPSHTCPYDYLDDSIKADTLKKITALQKAWEDYRGDAGIYDETKVVIPGCEFKGDIEG